VAHDIGELEMVNLSYKRVPYKWPGMYLIPFVFNRHLILCRRFIINDTYRSELCLLYPPHLIAIAAIYLTLVLHVPTRATIQAHSQAEPEAPTTQPRRRSSRQASNASAPSSSNQKKSNQDIIGFFAELNISMPLIATIAQEIISLYALWDRYKEDGNAESAKNSFSAQPGSPYTPGTASKRTLSGTSRSGSLNSGSNVGTPIEGREDVEDNVVTPAFLVDLLVRMRDNRLADVAHPASGRPVAVNKMLERTQAAG
jgi:cyclin-C